MNKIVQIVKDNPGVTEAGIYNQLKGMSYPDFLEGIVNAVANKKIVRSIRHYDNDVSMIVYHYNGSDIKESFE